MWRPLQFLLCLEKTMQGDNTMADIKGRMLDIQTRSLARIYVYPHTCHKRIMEKRVKSY